MNPSSSPRSAADEAILAWMNDFAPYGVVTTDRNFRIQTWNHWMSSHSGKTAAQVLNRQLFEVYPDLRERRLVPRFERALQGESSLLSTALHGYLFRMDATVRDGTFPEMQQTGRISPLILGNEIIGTIIVVEDVTQRELQAEILRQQHGRDTILSWALAHLLEAREPRRGIRELFLKIAEHLDWEAYLLYLLADDEQTLKLKAVGGITPEHEATLSSLSVTSELGAALLSAGQEDSKIKPDEHGRVSAQLPAVLEKLGFSASAVLKLESNEGRIGILCFGARSRASLREGELDLLSTIGKYLSIALHKEATRQELESARQKLNNYAENLERQVAGRTAELTEIIADLERFSYSLAHDLRAPIRALAGYAEVLQEDFAPDLPPEAQSVVQRLSRACKQLDNLTLDLLEFSKVSRAEFTLGSVDLETVINDALSLIPSARPHVKTRLPFHPVLASRALLQQCMLNLIDNAIKFAKEGQVPSIEISTQLIDASAPHNPSLRAPFSPARRVPPRSGCSTPSESDPPNTLIAPSRVRITVRDKGTGIAPELHRKIFGIFERGTNAEKQSGSGIGLAIVARAVERMGGTCGVESELGEGSCFWIELHKP